MRSLSLPFDAASPLNVLCLGAHSDDIEIGCGGTILRLSQQYPSCVFHWVVFSALGARAGEAQRAAALFAGTSAVRGPLLKTFQDGFMPFVGAEVKAVFEELKQAVSPDLIFTHNCKDARYGTTERLRAASSRGVREESSLHHGMLRVSAPQAVVST